MPKKIRQRPAFGKESAQSEDAPKLKSAARLSPAELLSFLKQTRGVHTWTEKQLATALQIGSAEAKEAIAALQLQGYVEPAGQSGKWRITEQGDLVSGAKAPRFTRQSIDKELDHLRDRIKAVNEDPSADYKVTHAVAYGDFLSDAVRLQAAEVGIRLAPKDEKRTGSAKEHRAEMAFLKQLRGKTQLLHIQPYEDWMASRSHRELL